VVLLSFHPSLYTTFAEEIRYKLEIGTCDEIISCQTNTCTHSSYVNTGTTGSTACSSHSSSRRQV